eukprot:jgi/Bigna1/78604/fgenesh1_pg.55_\
MQLETKDMKIDSKTRFEDECPKPPCLVWNECEPDKPSYRESEDKGIPLDEFEVEEGNAATDFIIQYYFTKGGRKKKNFLLLRAKSNLERKHWLNELLKVLLRCGVNKCDEWKGTEEGDFDTRAYGDAIRGSRTTVFVAHAHAYTHTSKPHTIDRIEGSYHGASVKSKRVRTMSRLSVDADESFSEQRHRSSSLQPPDDWEGFVKDYKNTKSECVKLKEDNEKLRFQIEYMKKCVAVSQGELETIQERSHRMELKFNVWIRKIEQEKEQWLAEVKNEDGERDMRNPHGLKICTPKRESPQLDGRENRGGSRGSPKAKNNMISHTPANMAPRPPMGWATSSSLSNYKSSDNIDGLAQQRPKQKSNLWINTQHKK